MANYLILLVQMVYNVIVVILILNALLSFAPLDPGHPARRFLNNLAEPLVRPFRRLVPPVGMFDLSVMVALFAYWLIRLVLVSLIQRAFA